MSTSRWLVEEAQAEPEARASDLSNPGWRRRLAAESLWVLHSSLALAGAWKAFFRPLLKAPRARAGE